VARGGRETVDHPVGGRDDVSNAVAGVLTLVASESRQPFLGEYLPVEPMRSALGRDSRVLTGDWDDYMWHKIQ